MEANLDAYILGYELIWESSQNDLLRVVLDVQIISEKLVDLMLDRGFVAAFCHKPRIMVAVQDDRGALTFVIREVSGMARSYGFQQNPMLKCQITGELVISKVIEFAQ